MLEKGLFFGGFNPFHYGHLGLLETGLCEVNTIDILIGNKSLYVLPWEVRARAVQSVLDTYHLAERCRVLPLPKEISTKLQDYDVSSYSALILGSDVLNYFESSSPVFRPQDRAFFASFPVFVVLEREGLPISDEARQAVLRDHQVREYPPKSPISASAVRQAYRQGADITTLMPPCVLEQIKPFIELFLSSSF